MIDLYGSYSAVAEILHRIRTPALKIHKKAVKGAGPVIVPLQL